MAEAPIMPLYTDAWLADTSHLTAEEKGAYMGLLIAMWRSAEPRLALDHGRLARIACVSPRRWSKVWAGIEQFFTIENGFLLQKRLSKERFKMQERILVNRVNGAQGGRPKLLKHNETSEPRGSVSRNPDQTQTEPTEKLSISISKSNKKYTPVGFDDWWAIYPRRTEKVAARKAFEKALSMTTLERLMDGAGRYANQVMGKDPQYTKQPATWLNKGCWEDEGPQVVDFRNRMPSPAGG